MTIINTGSTTATGVRISLQTTIPAIFAYQTTNAATNAVTGSANTPVDIPAGQSQTYVIGITPIAPLQPTEVTFNYAGNNTPPVAVLTGLNTLLLSASATPVPDIVALGATITADGIVNVAGGARTGDGVFAVATVNVGVSSPITASVDTGGSTLPATATICETNAATSLCLAPPSSPSVTTQINTTATTTFGVFVSRSDLITLDPGGTRIFVRFKDANGITRGATSVAVRSTLFVPLFQQLFTGEFAVSNFFDHNVPQEFVDANGNMVTFWGEIVPFFDGHQGYDFPMPEGTPLLAVADGTVSFAGQSADFFCPLLNRTVNGPLIEIDHVTTEGTFKSLYFHLSRADVTIGQRVQTGQQIGLSGNTGCSTRPHLHFETRRVVNGRAIVIDPYGWDGSGIDPWTLHPQGTESVRLWSSGQAPALFKETRLAPNPSGSSAPVTLTVFRWMGVRDSQYPNNEFVEVTLDPRFAPTGSADLTGFSLRNNNGDTFNFPSGLILRSDQPIRVFTGAGTNTSTTLFWGRSSGVWNNVSDCARLVSPTAGIFCGRLILPTCTLPASDVAV